MKMFGLTYNLYQGCSLSTFGEQSLPIYIFGGFKLQLN